MEKFFEPSTIKEKNKENSERDRRNKRRYKRQEVEKKGRKRRSHLGRQKDYLENLCHAVKREGK